jgi:hypothetical protein
LARTRRANRYCVDCGARLVYYPRLSNPKAPNEHRVLVYACRSRWWYLLPIFIGLIGGIIAYFAIRRDDPQKAKRCLMVGIGLTLINVILNIAILSTGSFEQDFSVNV